MPCLVSFTDAEVYRAGWETKVHGSRNHSKPAVCAEGKKQLFSFFSSSRGFPRGVYLKFRCLRVGVFLGGFFAFFFNPINPIFLIPFSDILSYIKHLVFQLLVYKVLLMVSITLCVSEYGNTGGWCRQQNVKLLLRAMDRGEHCHPSGSHWMTFFLKWKNILLSMDIGQGKSKCVEW